MKSQKKKLIEVALPLPEINDASAYDKMPGIGPHPRGLHQWWSRKPLPTARAVLFASVVDDPSSHPDVWRTEETQNQERERLFDIIREMMQPRLHDHPELYAKAKAEMRKYCDGQLPSVFDPFAGGGAIPLEASRLGLEAYAGDLNPVAVVLNKCILELAPRWSGRAPVNPDDRRRIGGSMHQRGTLGLAADIRAYGGRIAGRALERAGHLYPKVRLPPEHGGRSASVIAWLWAPTVASPDPAARGRSVPLMSTYWLANKKGSEWWLNPVVDKATGEYRFEVRSGSPADRDMVSAGTKVGRAAFSCLLTGAALTNRYIDAQANTVGFGWRHVATVAEGKRARLYLPADSTTDVPVDTSLVAEALTEAAPGTFAGNAIGLPYGFARFRDYFSPRQLSTLVVLGDLVRDVDREVTRDAKEAGLSDEDAAAYARDLRTFLALAVDRCADFNNRRCGWSPGNQKVMHLFGGQAIPMMWGFAEANLLGASVGGWTTCMEYLADCVEVLVCGSVRAGHARQIDAALDVDGPSQVLVSTDPPYYDNIAYAALSDFFHVWLRRTVGDLYPDLFSTLLAPKATELTASPGQFGADKQKAKAHFEAGFRRAFSALRDRMDPRFPLTVYYAFKQDDEKALREEEGTENGRVDLTTGWETLLEALVGSGFQIAGTWPIRSEQKWRKHGMGANALASCIVLACRPRPADAPQTDRRSFVAELGRELPTALRHLQQGNVAPVDFAQAAIGPGMSIYSRYSRVLESSGNAMTVRTALSLINQTLTEVLSEHEDEFDADTRWAIAWFEEHGFGEGDFGDAELLSKAKVTSVAGLKQAGFIHSGGGKVRLLRPEDLAEGWDPQTDKRLTVWEMTHHLLRVYFHDKAGDDASAGLLRKLGSQGEIARDLAYRLFDVCERKKRSQEAQAYNALVLGWPEIARLAREGSNAQQANLFGRA